MNETSDQNLTLAMQCKYRADKATVPLDYVAIREKARSFIAESCKDLLQMNLDKMSEEFETQIKPFIESFVDKNVDMTTEAMHSFTKADISDRLMREFQYSVLTIPLFRDSNIEKINAVRYDKIRVTFNDGSMCYIEPFLSATDALECVRKLTDNKKLDLSTPIVEGYMDNKTRVTAMQYPVILEENGVAFSIRKLNGKVFKESDYIDRGFISREAYNFLTNALRYGVSLIICGKVGTGKTSFINSLFSVMPDTKNLFAIENGAREINLADKFAICTLTRRSNSLDVDDISEGRLVETMLRFDADNGIISEMRSREAAAAMEASTTGISITSSLHAGGPQQAHERIADLYRKEYPSIEYKTALVKAAKAFPLIAYINQGDDYRRRVMRITEVVVHGEEMTYRDLFSFHVTSSENVGNDILIKGSFEKELGVSDELKAHMRDYYAPFNWLQQI